ALQPPAFLPACYPPPPDLRIEGGIVSVLQGNHAPMTPPNSTPSAAQDKTGFMPSLRLLHAVVISAAVAGPAAAQQPQTTQEPIVLETIEITSQTDGEAATDYRVTSGSSPKLTAPLVDTPKTVTVIT